MQARKSREINVFGISFMDVLANTIGGLAFLLILAVMMIGSVTYTPPQITIEQLPPAYEGQPYAAWLAAREGMGKFRWRFGQGTPPPGLQIDQHTGHLHGVIEHTGGQSGTKTFQFEVVCESLPNAETDTPAGRDVRQLALRVSPQAPLTVEPLSITTTEKLPDAFSGQPYPLVLAAEGGQPPYRWRVVHPAAMPPGLTLDARGHLRGQPQQPKQYRFSVTATDATGRQQVTKQLSLTVAEKYPPPLPIPPLKIVTKAVPDAVFQRPYSIYLAAEGGRPPYRWERLSPEPAWLAPLDGGTSFSGTPPLSSSDAPTDQYSTLWRVTDADGRTATSQPIALTVVPFGHKPQPLRLKTARLPEAQRHQPYQLAVSAEGGVLPYHWSIQPPLPDAGVSFSEQDGVFKGTPEELFEHEATVTVRDATGQEQSVDLTFRARPEPQKLHILTADALDGIAGQPYELALSATGGFAPYTWQLLSGTLPPGLRLDPQQGKVTGVPEHAGSWQVAFGLTDAEGTTSSPLRLELQVLTRQLQTQLVVKTRSLPVLLAGRPIKLALACEGGLPPYRWQFVGGAPAGLRTKGTYLEGTPTSAGRFQATLRAMDDSGQMVDVQLPIEVRSLVSAWLAWLLGLILLAALTLLLLFVSAWASRKAAPLKINMSEIPNARASCRYTLQLSCIGGIPPYRWTLVEGDLPPGLQLSQDGLISGVPLEGVSVDQTKQFPFTVQVRDRQGHTARCTL